jgi:hypothetical protein
VLSSEPAVNFGSAPQLQARGGAAPADAYLAFDVTGAPRPVALAKLSLRVVQSGGGAVGFVADTAWGEETINWSNAPAIGPQLVAMPQSSRDGTIGAVVTPAVDADADGIVSFALSVPGSSQTTYWSREGGQPPRLVLTVSCPVDGDGDGRGDACDCAPTDPGAFAVPGEVRGLRFEDGSTLAWDSAAPGAGAETRHDVVSGDLAELLHGGPRPGDVCLADDLADAELADPTPAPAPGEGRFFLVRGDNACGARDLGAGLERRHAHGGRLPLSWTLRRGRCRR